jgi:hypothetical protein
MEKMIVAALLIGSTAAAFAQDQMRDTAMQMEAGRILRRNWSRTHCPKVRRAMCC